MPFSIFVFSKEELIFLLVIFLLGFITGATFLNLLVSKEIDRLVLEKSELKSRVEEQNKQITNLKKYRQSYIKEITIYLEADINKHTKILLKEEIRQRLEKLYGQQINNINHFLLKDIIDGSYIPVEDRYFQLELISTSGFNEELRFYIKARQAKPLEEPE